MFDNFFCSIKLYIFWFAPICQSNLYNQIIILQFNDIVLILYSSEFLELILINFANKLLH